MYIYLDNYRGFTNTYVPISDVNFLVGENSTGKTSFLSVLKLLSSTNFWIGVDLNSDDLDLGHFSDVVSVHSSDRSYFRIGAINETPALSKDAKSNIRAYLLTFKNRNGLPTISRLTYLKGSRYCTIKVTKNGLIHRTKKCNSSMTLDRVISQMFPCWEKEHANSGQGFTELKIPKPFRHDHIPLLALVSLTLRSQKKDEEDDVMSFRFPSDFISQHMIWVAPIRTRPRRTYDEIKLAFSPEGTHTPYIIRKLLDSKVDAKKFREFMSRVGKSSGLFEAVQIRRYGKAITSPFEVDIVLDSKALNLSNVGYGVSQSLPVLVEVLARPKGSSFAIQQPEVHLHPRAQAALGDVIFDLAIRENKKFVIETHSDYLIDRFRTNYRRKNSKKPDAQILFFERKRQRNHVCPLRIDAKGGLPSSQPSSYRRFFLNEELKLLGA